MEALAILLVPAIVKAVELLNKKDWKSLGKITLAALAGSAFGLIGVFPGVVEGLLYGLEAAGVVTVAQATRTAKVGEKT